MEVCSQYNKIDCGAALYLYSSKYSSVQALQTGSGSGEVLPDPMFSYGERKLLRPSQGRVGVRVQSSTGHPAGCGHRELWADYGAPAHGANIHGDLLGTQSTRT